MAGRDDSNIKDNSVFLKYLDDFKKIDPPRLGAALGNAALGHKVHNMYIQICQEWLSRQPNPTWSLLRDKLKKGKYVDVVVAIETDHKISMDDRIKEVKELLKYADSLSREPKTLGSALGIPEVAEAIVNNNKESWSNDEYLTVLSDYICRTAPCTWQKFYEQLKPNPAFGNVLQKIKEDHKIVDKEEQLPKEEQQQKQREAAQTQSSLPEGGDGQQRNEDTDYPYGMDIN